ncbi:MAG: hypothetical protein M0R74_12620 [Dehalococcoidia bacterium]|nr:hypothetical protein [Dehalococcoidia bacterium]
MTTLQALPRRYPRDPRARAIVAFAALLMLTFALYVHQPPSAGALYTTFAPTQGDIDGKVSAFGPTYRDHNSQMIWQTSSACVSTSRLYNFCTIDDVFEHEIWLHNYHVQYPESYRWAHYNQGYSSNLPSPYIDVPDSDPPQEWGITIGSVDADNLAAYTWYYGNIVSNADNPGPNWYKLRFAVGDTDVPGCVTGRAWCMLSEDDGYIRIPFTSYYTFPNHLYWYGPY